MRPIAGRMRPKTSASGIFSTNRNRPVSTSMLTRILVPKPKKAFQSPGAHKIGRKPAVDVVIARSSSCLGNSVRSPTPIPSAHEGRAPAGICKNPKRLPNIHANGMPVMTSRRGSWEGDSESAENAVDSNRLGAARVFRSQDARAHRPAYSRGQRAPHNHGSVDKLSKRPAARRKIRQTFERELTAGN